MSKFFAFFIAACMGGLVCLLVLGMIVIIVGIPIVALYQYLSSFKLDICKKLENIIL
jgi:hypothetical protein